MHVVNPLNFAFGMLLERPRASFAGATGLRDKLEPTAYLNQRLKLIRLKMGTNEPLRLMMCVAGMSSGSGYRILKAKTEMPTNGCYNLHIRRYKIEHSSVECVCVCYVCDLCVPHLRAPRKASRSGCRIRYTPFGYSCSCLDGDWRESRS